MKIQVICFVVCTLWFDFVKSTFYPSFSWDPRNILFKKNENCNDEYYQLNVRLGDYLAFVCPSSIISNSELPGLRDRHSLYENMYVVTKEEFDSCKINKLTDTTRKALSCDVGMDPNKVKYELYYIMGVVAGKKLRFQQGKTYYFIATSNGTEAGLNRLEGGRCKDNNMRLALHVCDQSEKCEKKQCRDPVINYNPTTTPPAKPTVQVEETTKGGPVVVVPNGNGPQVQARTDGNVNDEGTSSPTTLIVICLLCGIIAGLLLGIAMVLVFQKYRKSESPGEVFTVEVQESQTETLRREANRKYFSEENAAYRNSTEFKRLLSTSSGHSTDRYSAAPVV